MPDMSSPTRLNRSGHETSGLRYEPRINGSIKRRLTSDMDMNIDHANCSSDQEISMDSWEEPARKKSKTSYSLYDRIKSWKNLFFGGSDSNKTRPIEASNSPKSSDSKMQSTDDHRSSDCFSTPKPYSSKTDSPSLHLTPSDSPYFNSTWSRKSSLSGYRLSKSQMPTLVNGSLNEAESSFPKRTSDIRLRSDTNKQPVESLPTKYPVYSTQVSSPDNRLHVGDSFLNVTSKPSSSQEFKTALQQNPFLWKSKLKPFEESPDTIQASSSSSTINVNQNHDHHEFRITGIESRKNSANKCVTDALDEWHTIQSALADIDKTIYNAELEFNRDRSLLCSDSESSYDEDEDEEEIKLHAFSRQEEETIEDAMIPQPAGQVLNKLGLNEITRKDIDTLRGLNWLNDEIINYYMQLIVERSKNDEDLPKVYAQNTFFYPNLVNKGYASVKRWTRKVDIFSYDLMLIPVHLGMHWCLAVIDFSEQCIEYYDSMGGNNNVCLNALIDYLDDEYQDKKKNAFDKENWTVQNVKGIPQQNNGSDCGVFTCIFAEYKSRRADFSFSQINMPYFRRRMVLEIVTNRLVNS